MKKLNKKLLIGGIIIFVIISMILIYMNLFSNKNQLLDDEENIVTVKTVIDDEWNEQIISKSVEVYSTKKVKQAQSSLKLPKEYNTCKDSTNMLWCIVFQDKETQESKKFINKEFVEERLNEISNFKKELLKLKSIKTEEMLEWILSDELQEYYSLTNPAMIYDNYVCKNNFCKTIIIKTKKIIVWRMISRQKINIDNCWKIPENDVKNYCQELLVN